MQYALAIDIGGSKLLVGIVSECGEIVNSQKIELSAINSEKQIVDLIVSVSKRLLIDCQLNITTCGISIPGLVDSSKGEWVFAPYSKISNFPIAQLIENILKIPVYIENDVNACALAEKKFGKCKNISNFFWMTISNGIGGAIYINNKLYKGAFSNAGEIGHINIVKNGIECGCGNKGCIEMYASGLAIKRRYRETTNISLSAKEIAYKANQGDELSINIYNEIGEYLGLVLSYVANILNIEKIVLGGGVMQDFNLVRKTLLEQFSNNVFNKANNKVIIEKTGLGYNAALLGAALVGMKGRE